MTFSLLFFLLANPAFRLEPGEYRWQPVFLGKGAKQVNAHYEVTTGNSDIHLELLTANDFRLFKHGQSHDSMAITEGARRGSLRCVVDEPGEYDLVVLNDSGTPAMVVLELTAPEATRNELSPARRLTVILISFGIFFALVLFSGLRLRSALKKGVNQEHDSEARES